MRPFEWIPAANWWTKAFEIIDMAIIMDDDSTMKTNDLPIEAVSIRTFKIDSWESNRIWRFFNCIVSNDVFSKNYENFHLKSFEAYDFYSLFVWIWWSKKIVNSQEKGAAWCCPAQAFNIGECMGDLGSRKKTHNTYRNCFALSSSRKWNVLVSQFLHIREQICWISFFFAKN